jgi:hypothetical protein
MILICSLRAVMTAASARTAAAQAAVTAGGWPSCGERSAARITAAFPAMPPAGSGWLRPMPVGAVNSVAAADLASSAGSGMARFAIWLRKDRSFRHF